MFVTITLKLEKNQYDIKIDDNQKINNVLHVLIDSKKYNGYIPSFYKSKMIQETISGEMTFRDAMISTGDILTALK